MHSRNGNIVMVCTGYFLNYPRIDINYLKTDRFFFFFFREFIKTLANFNKPIVAGIQGAAVGLGVTMLPLFDLVIASDKATFSTPYGQLGQIPEGAAILTLSQTIGNTIVSIITIFS